ncbi:MAG: DUF4215 domain-containing protein [Streptococcus sp.]|nr:DUF4215 domain-containing protein [Streptococcus sp.]
MACSGFCGDGMVKPGEICDDGDQFDNKGCKSDCTGLLPGFICTSGDIYNPSICSTICGDGIKAGSETCEDGNTNNGDGCSSTCLYETGWSCSGAVPDICSPICGDGIVVGSETCDDGTQNLFGCTANCLGA